MIMIITGPEFFNLNEISSHTFLHVGLNPVKQFPLEKETAALHRIQTQISNQVEFKIFAF